MITKDKLDRINELAKKKKEEGLTEEEQQERKALHEEYIGNVRNSLKAQLDSIKIVPAEEVEQVKPSKNGNNITKENIQDAVAQVSQFLPNENEELTDEEKERVAFISDKLGKEFRNQQISDEQLSQVLTGNPSNPTGQAGDEMLSRMNNSHKGLTDWALTFLKDENIKPSTILDIGCGGGAAIKNLHERYPKATIYGIDVSDLAIQKTIEFNQKGVTEDKVRVTKGSVENLPYGDDFFDLVVSIESYYFWPRFQNCLEQIKRVLKPNGTCMIVAELYGDLELTYKENLIAQKFNQNLLTKKEFKDSFEKAGFKNIRIYTEDNPNWICVEAQK